MSATSRSSSATHTIFLSAATSLPERTVDIHAVRMGLGDLAGRDLLGSSLFNFLILAVADLLIKSRNGFTSSNRMRGS